MLLEIHALGSELLSMDMYDRWGHGADPEMNKKMAEGGKMQVDRDRIRADLVCLVTRFRIEDPSAVVLWAESHDRLLAKFLETAADTTARYVANEERAGWKAVRDGSASVVDENTFYVQVDRALHRELFGDLG